MLNSASISHLDCKISRRPTLYNKHNFDLKLWISENSVQYTSYRFLKLQA